MTRTFLQYLVLTVLLLTVGTANLQARRFRQLPDSTLSALRDAGTSLRDSAFTAVRDSLHRSDSIAAARADSLDLLHKSSLERPAFTTAKDSIITEFSNGKRMIY